MAKVVEPPVLMSRILTFVLATSIVVLAALLVALAKMMPLERPEVFFLLTSTRSVNAIIEPLTPDSANKNAIERYEKGFVREYVIARNTLHTNMSVTVNNWGKIVKPWSAPDVFAAFTKTAMYADYILSDIPQPMDCSVNFSDTEQDVVSDREGYMVNFTWVCKNSGGHTTQKNYKIRIRIKSELDKNMSGTLENLKKLKENPLGIQVSEYKVLGDGVDPLDSNRTSW